MLKLTIEELCTLNLILSYTSVKDLLEAAERGYKEEASDSLSDKEELADLCNKVNSTL